MKKALILITILIGTGLFSLYALGNNDVLTGELHIDFATSSAVYTESHVFGVQTTVEVEANVCNECIRKYGGSKCLNECQDKLIYY